MELFYRVTDNDLRSEVASRWFGSYKLSEQCLQIRQEQFDMVRKGEGGRDG